MAEAMMQKQSQGMGGTGQVTPATDEATADIKRKMADMITAIALDDVKKRYQASAKADGFLPTRLRSTLFSETGGVEVPKKYHKLNLFVVNNNGEKDSLIWLLNMKEIFAKQLPKMPKEYIVRLCFDEKHFTLVCVRTDFITNKREIVGGVCFRPFLEQRFAEIAFLAVSAEHQVSGYGTTVMNHLKHYAQTIDTHDKQWRVNFKKYRQMIMTEHSVQDYTLHTPMETVTEFMNKKNLKISESQKKKRNAKLGRITHFLTYADNFAIGYFKKQGFTKEITISRSRYEGHIKDYDGGTLMECHISPFIDYLNLKHILKNQKRFLIRTIRDIRDSEPVYPGLKARSFVMSSTKKKIDSIYDIPGVKEAGWRKPALDLPLGSIYNQVGDQSEAGLRLQQIITDLLRKIKRHEHAWPFKEAVPSTVADYLDVIKDPIDLSLITLRFKGGTYYTTLEKFEADIKKMCNNCRLYNHIDTDFYKAADKLEEYLGQIIAVYKQSESAA